MTGTGKVFVGEGPGENPGELTGEGLGAAELLADADADVDGAELDDEAPIVPEI